MNLIASQGRGLASNDIVRSLQYSIPLTYNRCCD